MRVLCEHFYCPICRTDLPQVYFVNKVTKFESIPRHGYIPNRKNKMFFENDTIKQAFDKLLENRCKLCTHARPERTFKDLEKHMRKEHTMFYCSLCVDHLKLFPSERKYYNRHDLAQHRRQGDKDDSSYKGHPLCEFCDDRFMDKDELYRHLRKEHYFCHFCDPEGASEFYNDYPDLKRHFSEKHYLCQEGACSGPEIRLTHAFRSKIDLQAHTTVEHASNLTKAQAKQLRTIDIDYQLPRRDKRRDRGVVNAGDYEDIQPIQTQVYHSSRGGRQRTDGKRGFSKANFSEEDMKRAINASLDVMKDKEKEEKAAKEVKKEERVIHDEDNFPTLGAAKLEKRPNSPADSESKEVASGQLDFNMAKQIALKNKRSVQYGRLISNEFPTLSGETPSMSSSSETSTLKDKSSVPSTSSQIVSKSTAMPTPKYTSSASKGSLQSEDFPGLPTKSSTKSSVGSASWVSNQKKESKQAAAMPVQVNVNKTNNSAKTKGSKMLKAFNDSNDFPALGGQQPQQEINWLQKSAKHKGQPKTQKKPIDWFDGNNDEFEYSIENVTKISRKSPVEEKKANSNINESKKKKKKKDNNKSTENMSQTISLVSESSLDSIANSLLGTNADKKQLPVKDASPKPAKKEIVERTESPISVLTVDKKVKSAPVPSIDNKFSVLSDDTAPDISVLPEPERFKPSKKSNVVLKPDDFPALGSTKSTHAPPPGFAKPAAVSSDTKTPPGFSDGRRPPPGFSNMPSTQENGTVTSEEKKCSFTLKNIMPMMSEINNFDYVSVQNANSRNKKLIDDIKTHLGGSTDSFDEFKLVSAAFRQGETDATTYYNTCEMLIGKKNFDNIFPELLVLLPNISKQQELLSTYKSLQEKCKNDKVIRISGKSAQAPWSSTFQSCPTCRQVLLPSDVSDHTSVHSNSSDFPSLSGGGGPGLRAWVKGT